MRKSKSVRILKPLCLLIAVLTAWTCSRARSVPSSLSPQFSKRHSVLIFFAPKPDWREVPKNILEWRRELRSIGGDVILFLNIPSDIKKAEYIGFRTERVVQSPTGLPLLSSMLEVISSYNLSNAVGFGNSDLSPGGNFAQVLMSILTLSFTAVTQFRVDPTLSINELEQRGQGWLVALSRMDYARDKSDAHVHMDGGVDFWLWNNVKKHNNVFGAPGKVPEFRLARPWFDNWLTSTVLQVGGRHVVDGTSVLKVYHRKHSRLGDLEKWDDPRNVEKLEADDDWQKNALYAKSSVLTLHGTPSQYHLGIGTTCEAVLVFFAQNGSSPSTLELKRRSASVPCPSCNDCYSQESLAGYTNLQTGT